MTTCIAFIHRFSQGEFEFEFDTDWKIDSMQDDMQEHS